MLSLIEKIALYQMAFSPAVWDPYFSTERSSYMFGSITYKFTIGMKVFFMLVEFSDLYGVRYEFYSSIMQRVKNMWWLNILFVGKIWFLRRNSLLCAHILHTPNSGLFILSKIKIISWYLYPIWLLQITTVITKP